jgi:hypothetical protein
MGDGDGSSVWWREGASTSADAIVLPVNQTSLFEDNEEAPILMTGVSGRYGSASLESVDGEGKRR